MASPILSEVLEYDPSSPSGLRWKVSRGRVRAGHAAGWTQVNEWGYQFWMVKVNGVSQVASRVIWAIERGAGLDDAFEVDHIDGNPMNNLIDNLRVVPHGLNCRNRALRSDNTTGVTGVSFSATKGGFEAVYLDKNGTQRSKYFSCRKHGQELALRLAQAWRKEMMDRINGDGAGYTARHINGA